MMSEDYVVISLYNQYCDLFLTPTKFNNKADAKAEFDKLCAEDQYDEVFLIKGSIEETN